MSRYPIVSPKNAQQKYFFKKVIDPPLLLNEFRAGMNMGKRRWLIQENLKREKKRAVLLNARSFFIQWVAAGLARPATAAATTTTAATFIDWIDLAAPPVTCNRVCLVLF